MLSKLTFLIFIIYIQKIYSQTICYNPTSNCFDPINTQTLLFQYGQYTSCSRVSPIYKLNCIDSNIPESSGLCSKYSKLITNIKCDNSGTDDSNNIIWKCNGILPSNIALGTTTVSCEGCTSSSDKLKITGSCGIFYQLVKKTTLVSTPKSKSTTNPVLNSNVTNGFVIFICFLLGSFLLIGLIKCYMGEPPEYLPVYTNNSRRRYYNQIPTAERVVIPEITPLTTEQTPLTTEQSNNPPINPNYINNSSNRINSNIPQYRSYQTQSNIEMNNLGCNYNQQSDTTSLLSGYLVGKNLEEGNLGTAYLASTIGGGGVGNNIGGGNNYSTGLVMGMISGSEHSHKSHNRHKSHHKYSKSYEPSYESYQNEPSYESYQNEQNSENSFENSETFANTTTR